MGRSSGDCHVSDNWGSMLISPWWDSTTASMYANVSNAPVPITSFEIKGADQTDFEYQKCEYRSHNVFQCDGALKEPVSVILNDGTYYGVNIIESMAGNAGAYPLSSCGDSTPSLGKPRRSTGEAAKEVIGYYAEWGRYPRDKLAVPSNMDFHKVTIVNYAFFQTDANGYIYSYDPWGAANNLFGPQVWDGSGVYKCNRIGPNENECGFYKFDEGLISLVHAAGARLFVSIGGWTLSEAFVAVAADATKRTRFAEQCVSLIKDYGFDGIDLDWEYPTNTRHSGTPADKANFVLLLKELRSKLDAYGKQTGKYYEITAAVSCGPAQIQESYDILGIAQYLTQINLMSYDFHGDWESVTGPLAPLYYPGFGDEGLTVDACVKTWLKGCSGCKYNIGLPFYGRSFAYATGFNQPFSGKDEANWPGVDGADPGTPEYWAIEKKFRQMVLKRDEKSHTEMGSFTDGSGLISFDDEQAICDKVEYGQTHNLNGYIIWDIQGDLRDDLSQPLLDVVNKKLNNPSYGCSNAA